MTIALVIILGHIAAAILLGWGYFRCFAVSRPPIGVFNLWDVAVMLVGIVLVPYLYLILPIWQVAGLLALGILSVLYFTWEPIVRARWAIWLIALALVATDIGVVLWLGPTTRAFFAVNNIVLILAIVGIANLWAQSGLKARDAAVLAGVLAMYDVIVTWQLMQTADLYGRLFGLPLAPIIAWPLDEDQWLGIGMGDMLLATAVPLVLRKAFGRPAGLVSMGASIGSLVIVMVLSILGRVHAMFPVMIVLGPLTVGQYLFWRRHGPERTTWQYIQAESAARPTARAPS
jgi:hypothetical protein